MINFNTKKILRNGEDSHQTSLSAKVLYICVFIDRCLFGIWASSFPYILSHYTSSEETTYYLAKLSSTERQKIILIASRPNEVDLKVLAPDIP